MESLLKQLRELPKALSALPAGVKVALVAGVLAVIGVAAFTGLSSRVAYQYAFTNLSPEDSAEAASTLKAAGVPFRLDAGGSALAVPGPRVYDARLLLAAAGLPRGAGTAGFEIFDRGDLGVSEFTQRVNLRRATEGELARTISSLSQVRSARVHLTLPERGLYRDSDRPASAAVVVNLQPGRVLAEREVAGIRHLVASAVPSLQPEAVSVVDGRGQVLGGDDLGEAASYQRRLERDLEQRVVDILEQAVGPGAVVVRVSASLDQSEVKKSAQVVDPDSAAVRSERRLLTQSSTTDGSRTARGVAGAAANQPRAAAARSAEEAVARSTSTTEDETRSYDVSVTTTTSVERVPRIERLSVAVLVDGVNGAPRSDEELKRLGEIARHAVGFDASRGDSLEISSSPFVKKEDAAAADAGAESAATPAWAKQAAIGGAALAAIAIGALALRRRKAPAPASNVELRLGARVAEIEAGGAGAPAQLPGAAIPAQAPALADPAAALRDRARDLVAKDPTRAAHILKAWLAQEQAAGKGGSRA